MTKQVEVYVNDKGQPQHLAVLNEKSPITSVSDYRTVCGEPSGGMEVKALPPDDVHIHCPDCEGQLEMWKEIHS